MNKSLLWLVQIGNRPALHRLVGRLAPFAQHAWFPPLAGIMAFAATLSMTVPTVPMLCALVALNRRRWRAIAFWAVVGSASAGALFVHVLGHLGALYLQAKLPELVASAHWQHLVESGSHHGWWVLSVIAVSPIAQTPVLFLAAMLGMPAITVFSSLFAGKALKYGLMAGLTARAVHGVTDIYTVPPARNETT
ncbi:MAG: hypothetical protein JSS40_05310 [Proteobacteria bacterium]|nr:hypothetical protein [Pseudomonadota bacterium]